MSEKLIEEANIKFTKLCEIVEDIEQNGQNGDKFAQQTVFMAVVASDNQYLWEKIENSLFEIDKTELMRTVAVGLLMQKDKIEPLCQYAELTLFGVKTLNAEFEEKESLLLIADALAKAVNSDNETLKQKSIKPLIDLYKASCHAQSTAIVADKLLQRFISLLAVKNELIDEKLFELIKDIDMEINSRIVAIEILSRSQPAKLVTISKEIVQDLSTFASTPTEKVYFLDIITKFTYSAAISKVEGDLVSLAKLLSEINMPEVCDEAILGNASEIAQYSTMHKRIAKRISDICELIDTLN